MNDAPIPLSYKSPAEAPIAGWGIVRWWEIRRLIYNIAVLIAGFFTIGMILLADALDNQAYLGASLFMAVAAVAYGFCANVCYTGGWILDLAWKEPDGDAAARRRRGIFIAGLIFSCLVTTVPLWFAIGEIILGHL